MSKGKELRLRRLVRVAQIIFRREAAELALKQFGAHEAGAAVAEAERRLDTPLAGGDFLAQLSVVRAARARQQRAEADAQVHAQLNVTMEAMSKKKGAESELDIHILEVQRILVRKDADELLGRIVVPLKTSLG